MTPERWPNELEQEEQLSRDALRRVQHKRANGHFLGSGLRPTGMFGLHVDVHGLNHDFRLVDLFCTNDEELLAS